MNQVIEKEVTIENMIYEIRGKQVMLDSDLARLYQCKNGTKEINQAVKNNPDKFPNRFSFVLNEVESRKLLVKNFDQKIETRGGRYKNPRVFTEQGVAMLATILKTSVATQVSIAIMDAFVEMRRYIATNNYENRISNIETKLIDYDNKFETIFNKLDNRVNNHLFYEGQIYDAYSLLIDIFNISKESIIIIDNYIDKNILDILSKTNKKILIITNKYNNNDYLKYKEQYNNVEIKINNKIHDRFIIIDNKELYHCGASFKDLGKKCFAINKIENKEWLSNLINYISS